MRLVLLHLSTLFLGFILNGYAFNGSKGKFENSLSINGPSDDILIKVFKFESVSSTDVWTSEKGDTEISPRHFKDGQNSLLWNYKVDDYLVVADMEGLNRSTGVYQGGIPEYYEPAFYPKGKYGGIKMWLYQEKPQIGHMVFQVGSSVNAAKTNPKYKFEVKLDFKGWRAVWVCFEEDAKVSNYEGDDTMKSFVAYPSKEVLGKGEIFIDHFLLLDFVSKKRHSDLQLENSETADEVMDSYGILKPYKNYIKIKSNYGSKLSDENSQVSKYSKIISDKLEFLILGDGSNKWKQRNSTIKGNITSKISKSKKEYESLNLNFTNDGITGVPLFSSRDEHFSSNGRGFQEVSQLTMFPLAMDYRLNKSMESRKKLIELLDYFEDQGWASGSAIGTVNHVIRLNPMAQSIFLIREELAKQNKLDARVDMLFWHSRIGSMLNIDYTRGENTDKIRGGALVKLIAILLMKDNPEKEMLLKRFVDYMNYVIDFSPGYSDTIKPDFSIYHHEGTYLNSYGIQAVNTMALIHWLLEGTPYELSKKSTHILKNVLMRQSDIAFGTDLHYGVCGRFPYSNEAIGRFLLPAFTFLSMKNGSIDDWDLAKRYNYLYEITKPSHIDAILTPALTYSGTFGTLNLMVDCHNKIGNEYSTPMDSNISMPYSSLSVHRHGKAYAAVKGYSKYIWDFEAGSSKGENNMGRYLSHGVLLVAQNNSTEGFEGAGIEINNGFHWAYWPGATTKALPANKVFHDNESTNKYVEGYHRSFSETTFAGGLTQEGKNGMYAMELRDDVGPDEDKSLFDDSFRARKSYFFIDDEIICMGSNINNDDTRYNTITTLFQYIYKPNADTYYNGESIGKDQSLNQTLTEGYFTDQNNIHYIVRDNGKTVLEQGPQNSLKKVETKYEPINTPYVKAYLDHGKSPKNAEYEYQILLNTPKAKVGKFVNSKSYEVWQKDKDLHSIYHLSTGVEASAIFTANTALSKGHVLTVDTPVLAMFKNPGKYSVLTIADPDLRLKKWNHNMSVMPFDIAHGANEGHVVTVTLRGVWYAVKSVENLVSIDQQEETTVVKVFCKNGKSIDIPLQKRNPND
ncbi:chondroitinase family polysaccharide lyase [Aestuariivivens insulae]|uniref:chondroitinase family polysaccharide lyase n=1 Tax=Aestuariivivens insulae TaxID=1621988 RepID=UPI001F59FFC4|nr:chondroitinase family polysaccharide lyase [Aestuariivivens insulae]